MNAALLLLAFELRPRGALMSLDQAITKLLTLTQATGKRRLLLKLWKPEDDHMLLDTYGIQMQQNSVQATRYQ
jgi:hypothetical protein